MYAERFWKKNWDEGVEDLEPEEFTKPHSWR